jgi:hypothetical protein
MSELEGLVLSTFLMYAGLVRPEYFSQLLECLEGGIKKHLTHPRASCLEAEFLLSIYGGQSKLSKARMMISMSPLPILMIDP